MALRDAHRKIVEAFRANRTVDSNGVAAWDPGNADDALTKYVLNESYHHIKAAIDPVAAADDKAISGWLHDVPQDIIVGNLAQCIGIEKLKLLARKAEEGGEMWWAACRWSSAAKLARNQFGVVEGTEVALKCIDAIQRIELDQQV